MDARQAKLRHFVGSDLAAMLVRAGLDMPSKIRLAADKDLEAIKGIGPATRAQIQERFAKAK
jgi:hypothetical protein